MTLRLHELDDSSKSLLQASTAIPNLGTLVKELVYNSIDNCATCIAVRINLSKLPTVQVIDNGHGIKDIDELCQSTGAPRGFSSNRYGSGRGVLRYIIQLCGRVSVTSRRHHTTYTKTFSSLRNSTLRKERHGRPSRGTTISVEGIFDRIVVRAVALSYIHVEEVKQVLMRVALVNPGVTITLKDTNTGNKLLQINRDMEQWRVLAMAIADEPGDGDQFREINYSCTSYNLKCIVSLKLLSRPKQLVFVNRRYVCDKRITNFAHNILLAALLPPKAKQIESLFPMFVIFVECSYDSVDMCVEVNDFVQFKDLESVITLLYEGVCEFLKQESLPIPGDEEAESSSDTIHLPSLDLLFAEISPPGNLKSHKVRRRKTNTEDDDVNEFSEPCHQGDTEQHQKCKPSLESSIESSIKTPINSSRKLITDLHKAPKIGGSNQVPNNCTEDTVKVPAKRRYSTPMKTMNGTFPPFLDVSPIESTSSESHCEVEEPPRKKRRQSPSTDVELSDAVSFDTSGKITKVLDTMVVDAMTGNDEPMRGVVDSGYDTAARKTLEFPLENPSSSSEATTIPSVQLSRYFDNSKNSTVTLNRDRLCLKDICMEVKQTADVALSPIGFGDKVDVSTSPFLFHKSFLNSVSVVTQTDRNDVSTIETDDLTDFPSTQAMMNFGDGTFNVVRRLDFSSQQAPIAKDPTNFEFQMVDAHSCAPHITTNVPSWTSTSNPVKPLSLTNRQTFDIRKWQNPVFDTKGDCFIKTENNIPFNVKIITNTTKFSRAMLDNIQILRQVDDKYIIGVFANGMVIAIDQHAAHERVRLECMLNQLKREIEGVPVIISHPLKHPIHIQLSKHHTEFVKTFKKKLFSLGLCTDVKEASCCQVTAIPLACFTDSLELNVSHDEIQELFKRSLEQLISSDGCDLSVPAPLISYLHSKSCHGAIRFGDSLILEHCRTLIHQLSHCKLPFQCAHGRPSVVPIIQLRKEQEKKEIKELNFLRLRQLCQ